LGGGGEASGERRGASSTGWSAAGAEDIVVVVVAEDLCECEDVVPPGLGNVPYLTRVMIAATAVSRQICRDAEEGV